ncbi:unnamed protein product [Durusdinium trenchii]|uniref:Uncharacterized protein n=1 Tax=Durusdinium trenchii TaxID=1381693 RepID=A0ABP0J1Z3_9DINO
MAELPIHVKPGPTWCHSTAPSCHGNLSQTFADQECRCSTLRAAEHCARAARGGEVSSPYACPSESFRVKLIRQSFQHGQRLGVACLAVASILEFLAMMRRPAVLEEGVVRAFGSRASSGSLLFVDLLSTKCYVP